MTNRIIEEFKAICGTFCHKGAPLTPRHQSLVKKSHHLSATHHTILMNMVCHAFPQEWPALLDVLEFLYFTAPQGPHGLSAYDMSCGYAIASPMDSRLEPFMVPKGLPETEIAARLFENFRELYGLFQKVTSSTSLLNAFKLNKNRHTMPLREGDLVYRRLPPGSRLPKRLFSDNVRGPYKVVAVKGISAVLADVESGLQIDAGVPVPVDQLILAPERVPVEFEPETELRPMSEIVEESFAPQHPNSQGSSGYRAGQRKSWGPLAAGAHIAYQVGHEGPDARLLVVGKVLINHRDQAQVVVHPMRGV